MRIVITIVFFSLITSLTFTVHAQNDFAKLEQNVNQRAKTLSHHLNTSKDTLVLKSEYLIKKVYSVSNTNTSEINLNVNKNFIEIPLSKLSKGKHVFVTVLPSMRIIFVVKILRDYNALLAMIEDH